ncbi:MAG: FeoB-associated Cys-rich membrane protein [Cyclobacteriaceae bacterium]|nr:FeoB-associated Cys-rich membrane protein [Cyclobacteriaceae bacterium]
MQSLLVGLIFAAALTYVVRLAYKSFNAKSNCASGCGKCSAIDFTKIENEIQSKAMRNS